MNEKRTKYVKPDFSRWMCGQVTSIGLMKLTLAHIILSCFNQ